jgi:hypothetical protein
VKTAVPAGVGGTVSLTDFVFAGDLLQVKNRQTGAWDGVSFPADAGAWLASYVDAGTKEAVVRYAASSVGSRSLAVIYSLPGHTPASVSTNLAFEAVRITAEPVTSETDPSTGFVYNPSGIPAGGTDRFKIDIDGGDVQDGDITWEASFSLFFVPFTGGNTGREVAASALIPWPFTLEVDVKGLVITPPHVRPRFTGQGYPATNVPATVFIVRNDFGGSPARQDGEIPGLLADANKILRQRGITLVQNGPVRHLDNAAWLIHTNRFTGASLAAMLNTTNSMGKALELYFVASLGDAFADGVCWSSGIAIAAGGNGGTIAHEALHSCGLEDIYTVEDDAAFPYNPVPGLAARELLPDDWGGGYYPPGLTQRELVSRLLMRSGGVGEIDTADRRDLPAGTVYGWKHAFGNGNAPLILGPANIGQNAIQGTPGSF